MADDDEQQAADQQVEGQGEEGMAAADFPNLDGAGDDAGGSPNLDLVRDIEVTLTVELGRTDMMIQEILELTPGKVIELEKLAGEPLDILVNGRLLARGEVVVVDENFGVRITSIMDPRSRLHAMGPDAVDHSPLGG